MIYSENIPIEKYCVSARINEKNLKLSVTDLPDYVSKTLLYKLEAKIAVSTLAGEIVSYPKSAWEHFKQEYMPKWFIKRYPVKVNSIKYDFKVSYPGFALDHNIVGRGYISIYKYEHNYLLPA